MNLLFNKVTIFFPRYFVHFANKTRNKQKNIVLHSKRLIFAAPILKIRNQILKKIPLMLFQATSLKTSTSTHIVGKLQF